MTNATTGGGWTDSPPRDIKKDLLELADKIKRDTVFKPVKYPDCFVILASQIPGLRLFCEDNDLGPVKGLPPSLLGIAFYTVDTIEEGRELIAKLRLEGKDVRPVGKLMESTDAPTSPQ